MGRCGRSDGSRPIREASCDRSRNSSACQRIDGELNVHVALDLAAAGGVDELLRRLRDHAIAIVIEPVDQRADGRIFLIFYKGRVVKGAHERAAALKFLQQALVIDIEAES